MDLELVAAGLEFPEGPIALADGSVILTEVKGQRLTRVFPDGRQVKLADVPGGPNGAAVGPDGAIWIANNGGAIGWLEVDGLCVPGPTPPDHAGGSLQRLDLASGELRTVYDSCEGKRLIAPNDLVFDSQGGVWVTDYGCSTPEGRKFGALYYARADGSMISRQRDQLISPNGVGLSPDERTLYVADTSLARLWAFDLAAPGVLEPPIGYAPGRVIHNLQGYQLLDSLAVEAGGKICVATDVEGGVAVFAPDGGVEHFAVPDPFCTNICFGGADMRDAWITAAATGRLYKTRWPRPGLKLNFTA